jgi:hypothetical protein
MSNIPLHLTATTIVFAVLSISCWILSGFIFTQEIGEVNRKLPEDQQISYWWMYAEKHARIKQLYKRFYPNGRLHLIGRLLEAVGIALCIAAAIASGFFSKW